MSDYYYPVTYFTTIDEYYSLSTSQQQTNQKIVGADQILNSRGYLIKDWIQKNFSTEEDSKIKLRPRDPSKIACLEADILAGLCQSYFSIEVISSGRQATYTSTYRGVLEAIGDIGGLKEVVYLVFSLLYSMYDFNNRILKSKLVAEVYGVKKEKRRGKWCKKKIMGIVKMRQFKLRT